MNRCIIGSAAVGLMAASVFAFDADTLGFYAFKDAEAGTSAIGETATNSITGSAISAATIGHQNSTSQLRDAQFLADRPGKYIFGSSRVGAEIIAVDPQSVRIESSKRKSEGGEGECLGTAISFADAGTALSKHHDTGFTVEFFMRMNSNDYWYPYSHQFFLMCGYVDKEKSVGTMRHMALCLPYTADTNYRVGYASAEAPWYDSARDGYISSCAGSFRNGEWHHIALVERTVDGAIHFQTYVDGHLCTDYALERGKIDVTELTSGGYFYLGRGSLTAAISCIRFTGRSLDAEDFMLAADAEPVPAGEGAFAFYPFTGVEAGASAVGVTAVNQVLPGSHYGTVSVNSDATINPFAVFDSDAPGKVIYDGENGSVICTNPSSLKIGSDAANGKGGLLSLASIGTELSRHHEKGHTIEYFYKVDGTKCTQYTLHLAVNGGYKKPNDSSTYELRLYAPYRTDIMKNGGCCLGYYGDTPTDNPCRVDFTAPAAPNDGNWHHVALVETAGGERVEVYCDYTYCGSFALGGTVTVTANNTFRFFDNALQGKVSCLRFTDHALATTQFLRASSREVDRIRQPDVVAFYTFKDGEPGSDASTSTLCNDVAPWLASGSITLSGTEGANATAVFDDDAPGEAIYGGEEYPEVPFAVNPQSIVLNSDLAGNSGNIRFPTMRNVFYGAHGTGFTFEYFFKFLDNRIAEWDPTCQLNAGYKDGSKVADFHISMPLRVSTLDYLYGFGYEEKPGEQKRAYLEAPLWDGKWHHFAYVETPVVDTSVTPAATNWEITTWVDYRNRGGSYIISNIVASAADLGTANGLEICRNKHHCKYSCLKVTTRPLTRKEFMRTKPRSPGSLIIVR